MVKAFGTARHAHVGLTTLIMPGESDPQEDEMRLLSRWVAGLADGRHTLLHISRFFPRFHMTDRSPTDVGSVYRLAEVARESLKQVYIGNC